MTEETKSRRGQIMDHVDTEPASLLQGQVKPEDAQPLDDTELKMREALHRLGKAARRPGSDRQAPPPPPDTLMRRRFIQDGDVPVTVVRRGLVGEASTSAPGVATKRLQALEAALVEETAKRVRLQQSLDEASATIHSLQTRLGHTEVARDEAIVELENERAKAGSERKGVGKRCEDAGGETPKTYRVPLECSRSSAQPEPVKWWLNPKPKRR